MSNKSGFFKQRNPTVREIKRLKREYERLFRGRLHDMGNKSILADMERVDNQISALKESLGINMSAPGYLVCHSCRGFFIEQAEHLIRGILCAKEHFEKCSEHPPEKFRHVAIEWDTKETI